MLQRHHEKGAIVMPPCDYINRSQKGHHQNIANDSPQWHFKKLAIQPYWDVAVKLWKRTLPWRRKKSHHRNEKKDIAMPHWHRAKTMTSQKCHKQRHKKVTSMTSQKVHRCNIAETARTVHHHNVAKQPNCNVAATSQNGRYRDIVKSCSKVVKDCQNNIVKQLLLQRRKKSLNHDAGIHSSASRPSMQVLI